jgi:hypothetical protein
MRGVVSLRLCAAEKKRQRMVCVCERPKKNASTWFAFLNGRKKTLGHGLRL